MPTFLFSKFGISHRGWTPSLVIKEILEKIHNLVDEYFPNSKNFVIDATWIDHHQKELSDEYVNFGHIDNLFLCATIDCLYTGENFPLPKNPNLKIYQIGSINDKNFEKYSFNFAAVSLRYLFKNYTDNEVLLTDSNPKKFLCYQNKPHIHRQLFTHKIIESQLLNEGILTLQQVKNKDFLYSTLQVFSVEEEIEDRYHIGSTDIDHEKEIPYCLGDMKLWKKCFLVVIAETYHNNICEPSGGWYFITEKTFKPIIGMRPFVHNGNPRILEYLEEQGFYTFEDYWKDIDFRGQKTLHGTVDCCLQVVQRIYNMSNDEITDMYQEMIPKLQHNRNRFFQYAQEQENKIYTLFK